MSLGEQTIKCPICGKPYKFYPFLAKDQSACPSCISNAESMKDRYQVKDLQIDRLWKLCGRGE